MEFNGPILDLFVKHSRDVPHFGLYLKVLVHRILLFPRSLDLAYNANDHIVNPDKQFGI